MHFPNLSAGDTALTLAQYGHLANQLFPLSPWPLGVWHPGGWTVVHHQGGVGIKSWWKGMAGEWHVPRSGDMDHLELSRGC